MVRHADRGVRGVAAEEDAVVVGREHLGADVGRGSDHRREVGVEVRVLDEEARGGGCAVVAAVREHERESRVAGAHCADGIQLVLFSQSVGAVPEVDDDRHRGLLGDGQGGGEARVVDAEVTHRAVQLQDLQAVHGEGPGDHRGRIVIGGVDGPAPVTSNPLSENCRAIPADDSLSPSATSVRCAYGNDQIPVTPSDRRIATVSACPAG